MFGGALRIAEVQAELIRVRRARIDIFNHHLRDPNYDSLTLRRMKLRLFLHFAKGPALMAPVPDDVIDMITAKVPRDTIFADILVDLVKQLAALNRYERRALSRRKLAVRAFTAASRATASHANSSGASREGYRY